MGALTGIGSGLLVVESGNLLVEAVAEEEEEEEEVEEEVEVLNTGIGLSESVEEVIEFERRERGRLVEPFVAEEVREGDRPRLVGEMDFGRERDDEREEEVEVTPVLVRSTALLFRDARKKEDVMSI